MDFYAELKICLKPIINGFGVLINVKTMLKEKFKYSSPLKIKGFPEKNWYGGLSYRLISPKSIQDQFTVFAEKTIESIGKKFLPIYRMADGEFLILLGGEFQRKPKETTCHHILRTTKEKIRRTLVGYQTCWGEKYNILEYNQAINVLTTSIIKIADRGLLALYFAIRGDKWGEHYFEPMCHWFERNGIVLNETNYIPFYFVYALLNGPFKGDIFDGKTVCVVTFINNTRKTKIESGMLQQNAKKIIFYPISRTKALFEQVDLQKLEDKPDIVLVAGGIGSANLLCQFQTLCVPCIDCGIVIDCFVNPEKRLQRPFLLQGK